MPKNDTIKFDIRTLRRNIQKNVISKKEYDEFLKNLPDEEGNYDLAPLVDDEELLLESQESDEHAEPSKPAESEQVTDSSQSIIKLDAGKETTEEEQVPKDSGQEPENPSSEDKA